jgi:hypothetical protein
VSGVLAQSGTACKVRIDDDDDDDAVDECANELKTNNKAGKQLEMSALKREDDPE